ncbi:MAG TPA: serine/threonine-protein kinase [Gemmataceae bacterium]|nr:serine/threonine-protein kinase [Gemmataceae bacterium]
MSDTNPPPAPRKDTAVADTALAAPQEGVERPGGPDRPVVDRIPRQFGRYRIGDCLGKGGMGAVFKAYDSQLDRQVALKVPFLGDDSDDTRARFYREARAAATLQHANICPVFDVGEFAGMPYLTMAFIEGRSLADARAVGQPFSFVQIAVLVRKLALGMQEAHSHGVVHRDLKPANVLLKPNNEPMIMDFGLARRQDDQRSTGLTQKGDILGTVDYMSPEQVEGDIDRVGPAADIYALGVILYELLTDRRPFEGSTTAILAHILVKDPIPPRQIRPEVPARLEEICLKAMAKKPADRYASMAQFAAALAEFLRTFSQGANSTVTKAADVSRVVTPAVAPPSSKKKATAAAGNSKPQAVKGVETTGVAATEPKSAAKSSAARRAHSGRKRRVKKQQNSMVPLVLGGIALIALAGIVSAAVIFWPGAEKKTEQGNAPGAPTHPVPPMQQAKGPLPAPPAAGSPGKPPGINPPPGNPSTGNSNNPSPKPKEPGFALAVHPESVQLAVGSSSQLTVKVDRKDYHGDISLSWSGAKGVKVAPNSPIVIKQGNADPVLTLTSLSEPADPKLELSIVATATQDPQRPPFKATVAVQVPPGPCARVLEIGDKPPGSIEAMAFTPDGSLALIGGGAGPAGPQGGPNANQAEERNAIQVFNLERGEPLSSLAGHTNKVFGLAVSADGRIGMSVSADETVAIWDLVQGKRKNVIPKQPARVLTAAMSADGKRGMLTYPHAGNNPAVAVKFSLDNLQPIHAPLHTAALLGSKIDDAVRATAISPDHKFALIGGVNGKAVLIDMIKADAKPKTLTDHTEAVTCAAFSPTAGFAATGGGGVLQVGTLQPGKDNAIRYWNTTTAALEWTGEGHAKPVTCLAFSLDGKLLASGSVDGEVRVWNVADGKLVATFTGHGNRVLALAFTADQKRLWSGAADRTLRQWRLP